MRPGSATAACNCSTTACRPVSWSNTAPAVIRESPVCEPVACFDPRGDGVREPVPERGLDFPAQLGRDPWSRRGRCTEPALSLASLRKAARTRSWNSSGSASSRSAELARRPQALGRRQVEQERACPAGDRRWRRSTCRMALSRTAGGHRPGTPVVESMYRSVTTTAPLVDRRSDHARDVLGAVGRVHHHLCPRRQPGLCEPCRAAVPAAACRSWSLLARCVASTS